MSQDDIETAPSCQKQGCQAWKLMPEIESLVVRLHAAEEERDNWEENVVFANDTTSMLLGQKRALEAELDRLREALERIAHWNRTPASTVIDAMQRHARAALTSSTQEEK